MKHLLALHIILVPLLMGCASPRKVISEKPPEKQMLIETSLAELNIDSDCGTVTIRPSRDTSTHIQALGPGAYRSEIIQESTGLVHVINNHGRTEKSLEVDFLIELAPSSCPSLSINIGSGLITLETKLKKLHIDAGKATVATHDIDCDIRFNSGNGDLSIFQSKPIPMTVSVSCGKGTIKAFLTSGYTAVNNQLEAGLLIFNECFLPLTTSHADFSLVGDGGMLTVIIKNYTSRRDRIK